METKVCKCCGSEKPISEFYKNAWGYTSICSECHKKKAVEGKRRVRELNNIANKLEDARKLRLQDFTPRELMTELKRRGYEGDITYVEVHKIKLEDL